MSEAMYVKPWECEPGDRIVGTGMMVESVRYGGQHALGGDVERQRYIVTMTDGREMTYGGDSRAHVLRETGTR